MAVRPVELALAGLVLTLGTGELWVPFTSRQGEGNTSADTVAVVLVSVSLLWCRRRPLVPVVALPVVWGTTALLFPSYVLFYGSFVPLLIGVFMVVRYARWPEPVIGLGVVAGTLVTIDLTIPQLQEPGEIAFHWTVTALVAGAATGLRVFERRTHESTRRAVEAELAASRAVLEERTRIARELHDIVGHAMSSMVVQAGAAEQATGDEEFRTRALAAIRATGTDALAEMRRLVAMLRTDDEPALAPQPRLAGLRALVEHTGEAGGPATVLTVRGCERDLPAGLDLAAYRIVQEALTNVRRHAGADHCEVVVEYAPDALTLEVRDDGRGTGGSAGAGGHGLVGMRERVAMYGGDLAAGPAPDGGFVVRARLPVAVA